jgi:arginine:pyruvate transaminase
VGPEDAIASLINLSTHTTYGVPGFLQDAALWALQQGPEFEAEIAAPFRRRRDQTLAQIAAQSVVRVLPSGGAMYLMLDVRATGMTGEGFAAALLDAHHIATMPGESFGASAAGHIRLALTVDDDTLAQAIATLLRFAAIRAERAA